jgi:hypothetical protein
LYESAKRPDVAPRVGRLAAPDLRGHHGRRSHDRARRRQSEGTRLRIFGSRGGNAEVEHLGVAFGRDEHVRRLDVAMDHAARVGVRDAGRHLGRKAKRLRHRKPGRLDDLRERPSGQIFRGDVDVAFSLAHLVHGENVRVIESRGGARFAQETLARDGIGGQGVGENLESDFAVQPRVARPPHLAHAPGAEQRQDFVGAKTGSGRERHGDESSATSGG